jgi:hypothetical protein
MGAKKYKYLIHSSTFTIPSRVEAGGDAFARANRAQEEEEEKRKETGVSVGAACPEIKGGVLTARLQFPWIRPSRNDD